MYIYILFLTGIIFYINQACLVLMSESVVKNATGFHYGLASTIIGIRHLKKVRKESIVFNYNLDTFIEYSRSNHIMQFTLIYWFVWHRKTTK